MYVPIITPWLNKRALNKRLDELQAEMQRTRRRRIPHILTGRSFHEDFIPCNTERQNDNV